MKPAIKYDSRIIVLGAACFAASFLIVAYGWAARITMLVCTVLIMFFSLTKSLKMELLIDAFPILVFTFAGYCLLSMLWARDVEVTFSKAIIVLWVSLLYYMQYTCYQKRSSVDTVLIIAMLGGYAACFITVWQQGFDIYINSIRSGIRVYDQEYINANIAGAMAAHAILLNLYFIIYKRRIGWWTWLSIPALICVAGAGSKRSMLLLAGGCGLLMLIHSFDREKILKSALNICLVVLLLVGIVYAVRSLPMFATVTRRIEEFIGSITGTGKMDNSTRERLIFMQVGAYLFKKSPIIGCGINNPRLFNWVRETYLHSNMVELLAGGGIIGFVLYYSIHAYLLFNLWKYKAYRDDAYDILFVILIFYIIFDVVDMSYDQMDTYFYFMAGFLEVRQLKRRANFKKLQSIT